MSKTDETFRVWVSFKKGLSVRNTYILRIFMGNFFL